jgi:hypothetical protein
MHAPALVQLSQNSAEPPGADPAEQARTALPGERLSPDAFLSAPLEIDDVAGGSDPYNHKGRLIASR